MPPPHPRRVYSLQEKQHLLANLDLEVAHRTRQFETWLADQLENFNIHQQGQISRIPKQVRSMTMRDFGAKYNGNVQEALRGVQRERMAAAGMDENFAEIDKSERKRKWAASQEVDNDPSGSRTSPRKDPVEPKAAKNARVMPTPSPKKKPVPSLGPGNPHRSRLLTTSKATATSRSMSRIPPSPSPQKSRPPFVTGGTRPPSRSTSPTKHPAPKAPGSRVPSSSTFNPALPPKTPSYPTTSHRFSQPPGVMRLPRKDESMLSVNGSPLANPYQFGLGWFNRTGISENAISQLTKSDTIGEHQKLKRTASNIIVRRDTSILNGASVLHSRAQSQLGFYPPSGATSVAHSREQSQVIHAFPQKPPSYSSQFPQHPEDQTPIDVPATLEPVPTHTASFSALVAIPTIDGHLLEFDPLQTSPRALEALEGISDSAKKQARLEMGRLVQAAVDKWKIS
ncbi:hypothetical protein AMATHDRAFT_72982 [Amanita thiersii Skay4041]|uniref:Borealin N-terminal domain-containing protein n=1 Tax=Amanita thiersii Skay4041 TaxID=703135 RepID=A0A2A9P0N6_9AGAR|nr:hypothetical protein AMATHDRAFT_72982 [Amanita thiersii Skay4041]